MIPNSDFNEAASNLTDSEITDDFSANCNIVNIDLNESLTLQV